MPDTRLATEQARLATVRRMEPSERLRQAFDLSDRVVSGVLTR